MLGVIFLLLLLLLFTPSLSTPLNPIILPSTAPPTSVFPLSPIHCTSWPNWTASYREHDCFKTLDVFFQREVQHRPPTLHEFVTIGDRPIGRDAPVWVPSGLVVGSCVLVIANLAHIRGLPLPGEGPHTEYARTESASYWDVYAAARRVLGGCVSGMDEVGWGAVGEDRSLGVFIWGSNSVMQRRNFVTAGVVLVDSPLNVTLVGGQRWGG